MNTIEKHRSPVYRQLEAYQDTWTHDHNEAMACRDWEDAIAVGSNIFQMLRERENAWRDQVFRGVLAYSEEDNLDHKTRFTDWLATTRQVLADVLHVLEKRFGQVQGATDLRRFAELAEKSLREWQPPRIAQAIGLREMTLTPEAAAELDRILEAVKTNPPPPLTGSKMQVMSPAEFLALPKRS
jgi:hypothetical protein